MDIDWAKWYVYSLTKKRCIRFKLDQQFTLSDSCYLEALLLLEGLDTKDARPRVKLWFCTLFAFWKEPIQAIASLLRENIEESLTAGDNEYAALR